LERTERQNAIAAIITESPISTQEELVLALRKKGYEVTQATVSRDIFELKLVKVNDGKKPRYVLSDVDQKLTKLSTLFKETVLSIDTSLNMLVIKTYPGSANAACLLLDKISLQGVIGTLAGEDTILVIAKSPDDVPAIFKRIKEYL